MSRWFQVASIGIAFLLLLSGPGGLSVQGQEGGIIPPHEFSSSSDPDPPGTRFIKNRQDEQSVAQNPTNAQNLVIGANDWFGQRCTDATPSDCSSIPGVSLSGFAASFDRGVTFTCRGRINLSALGAFAFGDPSLAFDSKGNLYYGTVGFRLAGLQQDVFVAKSTDGGCSYPTAANVSGNPRIDDKDAIAVDTNPNSPCPDNVYLAWTELGKKVGKGPDQIVISHSTDGGQTWTKPVHLNPAHKFERSGVAVKADNGTVWVVWFDNTKKTGPEQHMAISNDCGKKFNRHITVAAVNPVGGPYPGASFRINSFPSLAVAPDKTTLYVAWADRTNGHSVILVAKSSTKGLTWSAPVVAGNVSKFPSNKCVFTPHTCSPASAFFPSIDVDPAGNVNVAFLALEDKPAGTKPGKNVAHYAMFVRQSTNGGATFSDPEFGLGFGQPPNGDDPDRSSTEFLNAQFLGDYIGSVSDSAGGQLFVAWTSTELASTCKAVDDFRAGTGPKPNVVQQCLPSFGNTDSLLTPITY